MRVVLLVLGLASAAFAAKFNNLQWKDCNPDPNRAIRFNSMSISPGVVKIPGVVYGNFDVDITRNLTGKSKVDLAIYKHRRILRPSKIPCIFGWGSCQYDSCELIKRWQTKRCTPALSTHNIAYSCECKPTCIFLQSKAKMVNQLIQITDVPWYLHWLVKGDFNVRARFRDTTSDEELGCLEVSVSVES